MDSGAIETLLGLLSIQKPNRILEIGSAIGYSAIRMAQSLPNYRNNNNRTRQGTIFKSC